MAHKNEHCGWIPPKTTRRYLHGPKAERMYTLWAEGKIIFGEVIEGMGGGRYKEVDASGLWFLHGAEAQQFDFHAVENRISEDGVPVHALLHRFGGIRADMEAVCNIARRSTCFVRIALRNEAEAAVCDRFGFILRSGKEKEIAFGTPDEYVSYAPEVGEWKERENTWTQAGDALRDGETFVRVQTGLNAQWDEKTGVWMADIALAPGEEAEITLAFGKGEAAEFCYADEKAKAEAWWRAQLDKMYPLPEGLQGRKKQLRHLVAQLLQCFCYPVGKEYLLARQGGMQRLIWPWETMPVLEALGRVGDFTDYIEPVLDMYFTRLQKEDGEISPMGENWANITASALYSFATYARMAGEAYYRQYRDRAMAAFAWMKETRALTQNMDDVVKGLFPPRRSTDNYKIFQNWLMTDQVNLQGMQALIETAEQFSDPAAAEIRAEHDEYMAVVQQYYQKRLEEAGDADEFRLSLMPVGDDQWLVDGFFFDMLHGSFAHLGIVEEKDAERMWRYMDNHDYTSHGLCGYMAKRPDGDTHIWYTTLPEYAWFEGYMRYGRLDKASALIDALETYSMTDEFYMIERFNDADPYYVPWSPNASGNGRFILMVYAHEAASRSCAK